MSDEALQALMARLRAGDEDAAAEVFSRFANRLLCLARSKLHDVLRGKEDPEDVVQSVYRSFFRRQREGQFQIDSWEDIWGILTVMTVRKCGRRLNYFRADRRNVGLEVPLPDATGPGAGWEAVARDPSPVEAAVLAETLGQLLRDLGDLDREILSLHLHGCTPEEISAQVGYSRRTVRRALDGIRSRLRRS